MRSPVAGFTAYEPVNAPVFSALAPDLRDTTSCFDVRSRYASTSACWLSVVSAPTCGCSGASTRYVAPKIVSGRVVNTTNGSASDPAIANESCAPSERPSQLRCALLVDSDQPIHSTLWSSRSA